MDISLVILAICISPFVIAAAKTFIDNRRSAPQLQRIHAAKKENLQRVLQEHADEITQIPNISPQEAWNRIFVAFRQVGNTIQHVALTEDQQTIIVNSTFGQLEIKFNA